MAHLMTARFRFWRKQHTQGRLCFWVIVAMTGLLLLSGCGYKGPLTLPPKELAQLTEPHHS